MSGAQLLLEVGASSSPPAISHPLSPSNWWALLRYYWAFDWFRDGHTRRMCLSDATEEIRFHHRQAMSEHIGVGVALVAARNMLMRRYPGHAVDIVDAEFVIANPALMSGVSTANALRPDYIVSVAGGPVFVLECKGASTPATRTKAMSRGMRQVQSLTHHGAAPGGFVFHTVVNWLGFETVVLDPEGDDVWSQPARRADRSTEIEHEGGTFDVDDVGAFRAEVEDSADAALLSWSGAEAEAMTLLPPRTTGFEDATPTSATEPPISVDIEGRSALGVESALILGGLTYRFFRGLDANLHEALLTKASGSRIDDELAEIRSGVTSQWTSTLTDPSELGGDDEVIAISPTGAVSRLTIGPG